MLSTHGHFGYVVISDQRYDRDVIVHVGGDVTWRPTELSLPYRGDYFHTPLSENELVFLEEEAPDIVIIGAGYKSMMLLTPQAKQVLDRYGYIVRSTGEAIDLMNNEKRRFVAVLHLTC